MASKIAFISCLTLLITLTSAAIDDQGTASQVALNIVNYLDGLIGSGDETVLDTVKESTDDFSFEFTNISFSASDSVVFDNYSIDTTLNVIQLTFHTSLYVFIPYYKGNGTLMTLPLNSEATGSISVDEIYFDIVAPFNITKNNNGEDILNVITYSYGFTIMKNVAYNLVFSDSKFNDPSMKKFLNDNWIGITSESSSPVYDALVAKWITDLKTWLKNTPIPDGDDNLEITTTRTSNNPVETTTTRIANNPIETTTTRA